MYMRVKSQNSTQREKKFRKQSYFVKNKIENPNSYKIPIVSQVCFTNCMQVKTMSPNQEHTEINEI